MKKTTGIVALVIGLIIGIYGLTGYIQNNDALEIGDVSISKDLEVTTDNNHLINWVTITGGVITLAGIGIMAKGS